MFNLLLISVETILHKSTKAKENISKVTSDVLLKWLLLFYMCATLQVLFVFTKADERKQDDDMRRNESMCINITGTNIF